MRVIIAGYGDLGARLARRLLESGHRVLAIRRGAMAELPGLQTLQTDLTELPAESLQDWAADAAICAAAPDARDEAAYRRCFEQIPLRLAAAAGPQLRRLVLVSSTAACADGVDGWVDESSSGSPSRPQGRWLQAIEQRLQSCLPGLLRVRPSGLYGPGRLRNLQRARAGEPGENAWSNRIHVEDAARAILHLFALPAPLPLYLLSDDGPAPDCEVLAWLRAAMHLPAVPLPSAAEPAGRRIANQRLRASGFSFEYADFRAGYRDLLGPAAAHRL